MDEKEYWEAIDASPLEGDERRAVAEELSAETGVPARLLECCATREDMERLAEKYQTLRRPSPTTTGSTRDLFSDIARSQLDRPFVF